MFNKNNWLKFISDGAKNFFQKSQILQDLQKNSKVIVNALLNKFNYVSKEEFEAQKQVLLKTKAKLEELEKIIKQKEEK